MCGRKDLPYRTSVYRGKRGGGEKNEKKGTKEKKNEKKFLIMKIEK